jgi:hypothetical protein
VLDLIVGHRNNSTALSLLRSAWRKIPRLAPAPKRKRKRRRISAKTLRQRKRILLLATDGYLAYPRAIKLTFGFPPPPGLRYAIVQKQHDEQGHVLSVQHRAIFGTRSAIQSALHHSAVSTVINTAFLERHNATDRHRNARKVRRTYRFSKNWLMHQMSSYFTYYTYNFCWPVHTLRRKRPDGTHQPRTPAMSAHLTDHIWPLAQWLAQIVTGLSG